MGLPRQVGLQIAYDGTVWQAATENVMGGSSGEGTYTVAAGDCLWNIAKRFLGNGAMWMDIYNANVDVIESTARAHGKPDASNGSSKGWWIWPGEVLTIPGGSSKADMGTITTIQKTGEPHPELGQKIAEQITEFSYTDSAGGQSDRVSLTMHDIGREWMGKFMPQRGANLGVRILLTNWMGEGENSFDCGRFVLDDISFSGRPVQCILGGVSMPAMADFKALPNTNTWEKTTLKDIASQIAGKAGVALHYDAETIRIAEVEQSRQTDSAFLYALCEKYGLSMKAYNHKIVIFDIVRYEGKDPVATLKEGGDGIHEIGILSWKYNTTVEGTYTGVNLDYTDPDVEETVNVMMGTPGRMYAINTQASGRYDAELQAAAKVNAANRSVETMDITIKATVDIVASHCIRVEGLGCIDGKYYVDQIQHSIGSGGYRMQLSVHKVQSPIRATMPAPSASRGGQTYTVVSGDTLWGISKKYYGTGTKWSIIYDVNTDMIESTAKSHGKKNSSNGHWIWPGEILFIPEG